LTEQEISEVERAALNAAADAFEFIYRGEMLAIVMQDNNGQFIITRPGNELLILRNLRDMDWRSLVRVAEEHL
jgi:hypothetical protein